jgi:hypothetical protein
MPKYPRFIPSTILSACEVVALLQAIPVKPWHPLRWGFMTFLAAFHEKDAVGELLHSFYTLVLLDDGPE